MLKEQITKLFDDYEVNKIKDVPCPNFKPYRNIFRYLIPQRIEYNDLRVSLKPKQPAIDIQKQTIIDTLRRYQNEFQFRPSAKQRVLTHTTEYTGLYMLIIFGFYSRHVSGWKRSAFVLKETAKTALYCTSLYGFNEVLYPLAYKYSHQIHQKPVFSVANMLSALFVFPLVFLIEANLLASIRKALFICAYGQLRDLKAEFHRFYKLYPDHLSSRIYAEGQRLKHPSEDMTKRLPVHQNTRASIERKREEKQELQRQVLAKNNGEKIPSSNMYLIMPELYRPPTEEEKKEHERKAAEKTQQILDEKGIKWVTVYVPEDKKKELQQKQKRQKRGQKTAWWPW